MGVYTETLSYFVNDAEGTPLLATDAAATLLWSESYRPYGDPVQTPLDPNNNLWYTGKSYDSNTGLTYLGARYYDPLVGRFMGIDPLGCGEGNLQSFNRYAYANNNPYKFVDPDGLAGVDFTLVGVLSPEPPDVKTEIAVRGAAFGIVAAFLVPGVGEEAAMAVFLRAPKATMIALEVGAAAAGIPAAGGAAARFTQAQLTDIRKIYNIIANNALPKDFNGVRNELAGIETGWDHVTEMKNSANALKEAIKGFEGSLKNPNLDAGVRTQLEAAREAGVATRDRMNAALKGEQ